MQPKAQIKYGSTIYFSIWPLDLFVYTAQQWLCSELLFAYLSPIASQVHISTLLRPLRSSITPFCLICIPKACCPLSFSTPAYPLAFPCFVSSLALFLLLVFLCPELSLFFFCSPSLQRSADIGHEVSEMGSHARSVSGL